MGTRFVSCAESPVHANYKNAILAAKETGTLVLNQKSTPCIRALKSQRSQAIHDAGLMPPDALQGIREVYFRGDMEAAPALAGQSAPRSHFPKGAAGLLRAIRRHHSCKEKDSCEPCQGVARFVPSAGGKKPHAPEHQFGSPGQGLQHQSPAPKCWSKQ